MGYATISKFRALTNIDNNLISDQDLIEFLPIADRLINKLISTKIVLERLNGRIDGTNKDFRTKFAPICDTTLKNVTSVDNCDTADYTESSDATADTLAGSLSKDGGSSIAMGKDSTSTASINYTKATTAADGTGRRLKIAVYIKNITELVEGNAMEVKIGSASNAYYTKTFTREELRNGLNEVDILLTDMGTSGTPVITALDYIYIEFNVPASANLITHGDLKMDNWRLEDIDSPDISDMQVYYATNDDNTGFIEYGTANTITSFQAQEGIVTMTTAPTTTTAEAGVYGTYAYVSREMDWVLVNTAACYMAAHLCSFKIAGSAPNYSSIEDSFMRRDLAGAPDEWLRLCYSILDEAVGLKGGVGFRSVESNVGWDD